MAKTTELQDEERAFVKILSVQGLSIRLEYCFSPSNDSERMPVCRKANERDNPQCLASKFSNSAVVMFCWIHWA